MMQHIKKNKRIYIFISILTIIIVICFLPANMKNLPKGEFLNYVDSPDSEYTLKSYFIDGGSLSGDAIRVELINNKTKEIKNIYYDYPKSNANMKWIDNETVEINDKKLNINKDTYNWKNN